MLFRFAKSPSTLFSFCKLHNETLIHLFSSCRQVILLWIETKRFFLKRIQLTLLSPQITTFGLVKGKISPFLIQKIILIVFKLYVYKSRFSCTLNFNTFLHQLVEVKNLENGAAFNNKQKHEMPLKRWSIVENSLGKWEIFYYQQYEQYLSNINWKHWEGTGIMSVFFYFHFVYFVFSWIFYFLFFIYYPRGVPWKEK